MCRTVLYRVTTLHVPVRASSRKRERGRSVRQPGKSLENARMSKSEQERARTDERREEGEGKDNLLCCQYVAHNDRLLDFSDMAIIVATDLSRSSLA